MDLRRIASRISVKRFAASVIPVNDQFDMEQIRKNLGDDKVYDILLNLANHSKTPDSFPLDFELGVLIDYDLYSLNDPLNNGNMFYFDAGSLADLKSKLIKPQPGLGGS